MSGSIRTGTGQITYDIADNNNAPAIAVQSGIQANDVLVLPFIVSGAVTISSLPTGFSLIGSSPVQGSQIGARLYVAIKNTASGSESGSFTINLSGYAHSWLTSFTVTGVSNTLVATNSAGAGAYTNIVSIAAGSVSTGAANNYEVYIGAVFGGGGNTETPTTFTPPTGFTTQKTNSSTSADPWAMMLADYTDPSNRTVNYTGSITMSASNSFDALGAVLVFTPSGGAPASTVGTYAAANVPPADVPTALTQRSASGGALPRVCTFIAAAPLFMDLSGTATRFHSAPGLQGRTVSPASFSRPADPLPLSAQTQNAVPTVLGGKLGAYQNVLSWPDDRPTESRFASSAGLQGPSAAPFRSVRPDDPFALGSQIQQAAQAARSLAALTSSYLFGTHEAAIQSAERQKSQTWKSANASLTGTLGSFQYQGPTPLDVIQPVLDAPTFNPQGPVLRTQLALQEPLPLIFSAQWGPVPAAVSVGTAPLKAQWAAPQTLDVLQPFVDAPSFNPQGPVLRAQSALQEPLPLTLSVQWGPTRSIAGPTVRAFSVPPGFIDLSGSAWRIGSQSAPLILGPTIRPFSAQPAWLELSGAAKIVPAARALTLYFNVPSYVGLSQATADYLISQSNFTIGTPIFSASATLGVGIVSSQFPAANTSAQQFAPIRLTISSGPQSPVVMPNQPIKVPSLPHVILPPDTALVDNRGILKRDWWRFFLNVSQVSLGTNNSKPATVSVTASPFVYTATVQGSIIVSGGPVSLIEYSKDGKMWFPTGLNAGVFQLVANDSLRITYTNAPSVTFFPR